MSDPEMWTQIAETAGVLGGLGIAFGIGLAKASKVFHVDVDPRVDQVDEALPGVNCGGCGYAGCSAFAKALVAGETDPAKCVVGGVEVAEKVAGILGIEVGAAEPMIALVRCRGDNKNDRFIYEGIHDCRAVAHPFYYQGPTPCPYGCLGFGSCVEVCEFDAIHLGEKDVPVVNAEKCVGCGACAEVCPRNIIELVPMNSPVAIRCNNPGRAREVNLVCGVGCLSCRKCVKECKFEAIQLIDGLIKIDWDKCRNCLKCVKVCPRGMLVATGRKLKKKRKVKDTDNGDKSGND